MLKIHNFRMDCFVFYAEDLFTLYVKCVVLTFLKNTRIIYLLF